MGRIASAGLIVALARGTAHAEPYRLRADSFGRTNAPSAPVGLVMLQGEDRARPWVDAEALVWAGSGAGPGGGSTDRAADVLVVLVRLHDETNRTELRLGRQIITAGAVRPVHVDGADARARLPSDTGVEVFGGLPVQPTARSTAFDWLAGGRLSQPLGRETTMGFSYLQRRDDGRIAYDEAGLDLASSPTRWFDLAARGAYDLVSPGLTEVVGSLATRIASLRPELYATHRSPSRLLPATSLFSALGDIPSDVVGAAIPWRAAPRLDVVPTAAVRAAGGETGLDASLRASLRLDEAGRGGLLLEVRRQGLPTDAWTGARAGARVPLGAAPLTASTELEIVVPDDPRARGTAWPWALGALAWHMPDRWEIAAAVEARATPRESAAVDAILRVSKSWGGR